MRNNEKVKDWLKRAKSNLAFAKVGLISSEILLEDLCFNAQQAAEKSLKALCIAHDITFPKTHDLAYLIELIESAHLIFPDELQSVKMLTNYAVETRYPGNYEPVTKLEYQTALEISEKLVTWITTQLASEQ